MNQFGVSFARPVLLVLFLNFAVVVEAQTVTTGSGSIVGTVKDESGSLIPGVTVTATSPAMMGPRTSITVERGEYRLTALPPGEYQVVFELTGFAPVRREGVVITAGFTATIEAQMKVGSLQETLTVVGGSPVVDTQSVAVRTSYDAKALALLPGARDPWAIMSVTPSIQMSRLDVGGSGAWTQQGFQAYGVGGNERHVLEGLLVNDGNFTMVYTDFSSFADISVTAVGSGADMPSPGVMAQYVAKSGGDTYHGNAYFDYQHESMEAHNIDQAQIDAGLVGSSVRDVRDLNRLEYFRDLTADIGGFIKKNRVWWYGSIRDNRTGQRYPTLLDDVQDTWGTMTSAKVTTNLGANHRLIGYFQHAPKIQPNYLGAIVIGGGRNTAAQMTADSVWHADYDNYTWKGEYNGTLGSKAFLQLIGGSNRGIWSRTTKNSVPRVEDIGSNFVHGGMWEMDWDRKRPQANGSLTYTAHKLGTHDLKVGGELVYETWAVPFRGFTDPRQSVSIFNNGVPTQARIYLAPSKSVSGLWTYAAYVNDNWRVTNRLTVLAGLRYDRYVPFLPEQVGPRGELYAAVDQVILWNNWGPRLGMTFDLTGDAKTVAKFNFGRYFNFPAADFAMNANPNSQTWFNTYSWSDPNRNGVYDSGEEGALQAVSGGTLSAILDPRTENAYQYQMSAFLERELGNDFGFRTGFVWKAPRSPIGSDNPNRPYSAFNVPTLVRDPGPDGVANTNDDGAQITAYGLDPAALALPIASSTHNFGNVHDNYYTWEVSVQKRRISSWWSSNASFSHTWSRLDGLRPGQQTPNSLIGLDGEKLNGTTWQAKMVTSLELPRSLRVTPVLRYQSGTQFNRTFSARLNYSNAVTLLAEPANSRRTPNITLLDVRTEKSFRLPRGTVTGFFDVYNIFNTNAEQALTSTSGSAWLRPTAITAPRVARVGIKFDW